MFSTTLWWHITNCAFKYFKQGLLHPLTGYVASNGNVFSLARDLVDFVDINDAALSAFDIVVGILQQAQDDILNILANVAGLGQSSGISHGERDVEDLSQGAGEESLA